MGRLADIGRFPGLLRLLFGSGLLGCLWHAEQHVTDYAVDAVADFLDSAKTRTLALLRLGGPLVLLGILGRPLDTLQRQADLPVVGVHAKNLDLDLLADLDDLIGVADLVVGQFADVQQAFQVAFQFDKHAEVRNLGDLALDDFARHVGRWNPRLPRVFLKLLQAQGHSLLVLVHVQHLGLDHVTLLDELVGMADLAGPGHVADVQQAVDPFLDLDEGPVIGQVADLTLDDRSRRILVLDQRPGVDLGLLHAQADLLLALVDVQHHHFDLVADLNHLARVVDPLGPGHLADVDQALDSVFKLDKGPVVHDVDRRAGHL